MSKKIPKKDPYAAREAEKYTNPIPSREYIIQHLLARNVPANLAELCIELKLVDDEAQEALRRRIKAMLRDGQLEQLKKRRFWPYGKRLLVEGTLTFDRHKNLWCFPASGGTKISIPHYDANLVTHGSKVVVSIPDRETVKGDIIEGKIVEVISAAEAGQIVGRFIEDKNSNYVISHEKESPHDIIIPAGKNLGATDGDIVLVEVTTASSKWEDPVGHVVKLIGSENNKGVEIDAAIHVHNLPHEWPQAILNQVAKIPHEVIVEADNPRVDLRGLPLVTIDGEDAKDFDDAVYCQAKPGGGWTLYVAIADVSHYVKPNTQLDKEALLRGNSVYFPGKVIPMLPEKLSNGLCSLLPEVDRLCMVCEMAISSTGKLTRYKFYEGIMRSHARLTYTKVAKIVAKESKQLAVTYANILPDIFNLHELYLALHSQRELRGAIDFDTVSTHIIFNSKGKISSIEAQERNVAHKIIEECMLCANVATAKFLEKHKIPGLYRVHETPPTEKIADLRTFLGGLGLALGSGGKVDASGKSKPHPLDYGQLLKKVKYRPDASVIQTILLRSMCQAVYSPDNIGHFGLAFPAYAHFTSPIRRYPDLLVHRQIKTVLNGQWQLAGTETEQEKQQQLANQFKDFAVHCSTTERRADDATRYVDQWLKCQYMCQHLGKSFAGIISGVNRFGFFVELSGIYVDGLVHVSNLRDDFYHYDAIKHQLVGERNGTIYSLGMSVVVIVAKVDVDNRRVDLEVVSDKKGKDKAFGKQHAASKAGASKQRPGSGKKKFGSSKSGAGKSATTGQKPKADGASKPKNRPNRKRKRKKIVKDEK